MLRNKFYKNPYLRLYTQISIFLYSLNKEVMLK